MSFEEFLNRYNGKYVEKEDPSARDQCMDLAFAYLDDVLEIDRATIRHEYASQVFTQPNQMTLDKFDLIPNTPDNIPQRGDIIIFGQQVGIAGHIAMFIDGNKDNFNAFGQNWPLGSAAHIQNHNYYGVIGWLHPKSQGGLTMSQYEELKNDNADRMRDIQETQKALNGVHEGLANVEKNVRANNERLNKLEAATPGLPADVTNEDISGFNKITNWILSKLGKK